MALCGFHAWLGALAAAIAAVIDTLPSTEVNPRGERLPVVPGRQRLQAQTRTIAANLPVEISTCLG
jgi:hypothetical protein